jgi:3,5-epimerase/4-reductase
MKNALIFGEGFIGSRLQKAYQCNMSTERISNISDALAEVYKYDTRVIINCIGYTGLRNVDDCETEPMRTINSNVTVPIILAEAAFRAGIKFVHISSGCIYHYNYAKDSPITEEQEPNFFDLLYSRTKIYAEKAISPLDPLIVRIRIPVDDRPHPRNIITKLLSFSRILDLPNSVTYIPDFIHTLRRLIKYNYTGIFNVVNEGGLRYPDILDMFGVRYEKITMKDFPTPRTNLLMSVDKLKRIDRVRNINDVLEECVNSYKDHLTIK